MTPATTYEYQLVGTANETTSIIGRVATFTTETNIVLQNGGFEDWHQNGKIWYAASESDFKGGNYLWDSSNPMEVHLELIRQQEMLLSNVQVLILLNWSLNML